MADYDLAVVGAGIIGLATALAAAKRGLRVVVVDRDAQANGASIRNFGLVVVSGQSPGQSRSRAARTREIWLDIAGQTGIEVLHRGKLVIAQRPEAMAVLEAYAATKDGENSDLLNAADIARQCPAPLNAKIAGGLYSPYELRVESRDVIPRLAAWLEQAHRVEFRHGVAVTGVSPPVVSTSRGDIRASKIVICPGDDLATLFPERIATYGVKRCKLHMMRLADPGFRLGSAIVSDLSLLRYGGYAAMPQSAALKERLMQERGEALANGVHLIVVQSADGSLVIGDSHQYGATPDPFAPQTVDQMILGEYSALFGSPPPVVARWTGTYSSAASEAFIDAPHEDVRLVMITSGTGASTSFAIGEETVSQLFGA